MRKVLVVAAMIVFVSLPVLAQSRRPPTPTGPVPRLPDGTVDLSGAWLGGAVNHLERDGGLKPGDVDNLMLPWAKALMQSRTDAQDPYNFCLPQGVPRLPPFPYRLLQHPSHKAATHIFILYEGSAHMFRQIFMGGRKHPEYVDPSWFGHSIGSWEKDTLVIDTVGFNDIFWFDRAGHPHTEQLHTIERWTRKDLGHLESRTTIDDPGAYSKPFTVTFNSELQPADDLLEYICIENNQFGLGGGHSNPYYGTPGR